MYLGDSQDYTTRWSSELPQPGRCMRLEMKFSSIYIVDYYWPISYWLSISMKVYNKHHSQSSAICAKMIRFGENQRDFFNAF